MPHRLLERKVENNFFESDNEFEEFVSLAADLEKESEANNEIRTSSWAGVKIDYDYNPFSNQEVQNG